MGFALVILIALLFFMVLLLELRLQVVQLLSRHVVEFFMYASRLVFARMRFMELLATMAFASIAPLVCSALKFEPWIVALVFIGSMCSTLFGAAIAWIELHRAAVERPGRRFRSLLAGWLIIPCFAAIGAGAHLLESQKKAGFFVLWPYLVGWPLVTLPVIILVTQVPYLNAYYMKTILYKVPDDKTGVDENESRPPI